MKKWFVVTWQNCCGGVLVHGGGQYGRRKLLWQFTVAIKSDSVALVQMISIANVHGVVALLLNHSVRQRLVGEQTLIQKGE